MPKPNPMGGTFAERTAATNGDSSFTAPAVDEQEPQENSTFAERAQAAKKTSSKQVESGAENKAVAKKAAAQKS